MQKIKVVFAYCPGKNGNAFGKADGLPWPHQKDDMKLFMEATAGCVCVMGCKTWESLPKSLPGRINVVLARPYLPENKAGEVPDMVMHGDLRSTIYDLQTNFPNNDIAIIGGLSIIEEAVGFADTVITTRLEPRDVHGFDADTFVSAYTLSQIMNTRTPSNMVVKNYAEEENADIHAIIKIEWKRQ